MYHDPQAAFYGGYDRTNLAQRPLFAIKRVHVALSLATAVLVLFLAADVLVISAAHSTIKITSVSWTADGTGLATTSGFTVRGGQVFAVSLTCASVCYPFVGAAANAPFSVVSFTTELQPIQFTNVTVRAPTSSYYGVLIITLQPALTQGMEPAAH